MRGQPREEGSEVLRIGNVELNVSHRMRVYIYGYCNVCARVCDGVSVCMCNSKDRQQTSSAYVRGAWAA